MKTTDGGKSWKEISPDLTVRPDKPGEEEHKSAALAETRILAMGENGGHGPKAGAEEYERGEEAEQAAKKGGAISVISPSPVQSGIIWAGTNNGLVERTLDGAASWQNVSPGGLTDKANIWTIEPSRYEANTAYVTFEIRRDTAPYIFRTRDGGKTWQKITAGLRANWLARAVREDPVRKGLLYAATEDGVYVSFDDGDHWQELQLNLPTSDVQDITVHGNDLIAATYGRALRILDDLTSLRQASADIANSSAYLLRPP